MSSEIEIKLTLDPYYLPAARDWLLARPGATPGATVPMRNIYYDTPDGQLNRQRMALRIRQAGARTLQTLKTRGEVRGGVVRRGEWEWALPSAELDREGLAGTPLEGDPVLERVQPCFETCFERQLVDLELGDEAGQNAASIECALDQGEITAGSRQLLLCELELELKRGDEKAISRVAAELAAELPALVNSISKGEQGYYLADLYPGPESSGNPVENWIGELSWAWLQDEPRNWATAMEAHMAVREEAARSGLGDLWRNVWERFSEASQQQQSPRQTLINLPGLARLQLGLALG